MADYTKVADQIKAGIPLDVLCATCPWDRLCVNPPAMSEREVERRIAEAEAKDRADTKGGMPVGMLMTALVFGQQSGTGQLCPVFAARLSSPDGRQVADAIRGHMRGEKVADV